MEENGEDTSNLKPPETNNSDYVPCPYCQRKFAPRIVWLIMLEYNGILDRHR